MPLILVILAGVVVGAGAGSWILGAVRHYGEGPNINTSDYELARRALLSHIHAQGTVNLIQAERILDINSTTALKCLDLMVADGHLKEQSHARQGIFYTLV